MQVSATPPGQTRLACVATPAFPKDHRWFIEATLLHPDGTTTKRAKKMPTGESLCLRCGRAVEAFVEEERSSVIRRCNREIPFRQEFEAAADVLDSDGPNPFRKREVHALTECGLVVELLAALVPIQAFEQHMEFSVSLVNTITVTTLPAAFGGTSLTGVVCDPDGLPENLQYFPVKLYFKKSSVLTEEYLQAADQGRDEQGARTWQWLAKKLEKDGPCTLSHEKAMQSLPSWGRLQELVAASKEKVQARERDVVATMAAFGLPSAAPSGVVEVVSSASRLATFATGVSGDIVEVAGKDETTRRGRGATTPAKRKGDSGSLGGASSMVSSGKKRKAEPGVKNEADLGAVFLGCVAAENLRRGEVDTTKTSTQAGVAADSMAVGKGCYYQHKGISMEEVLQGKKSQGQKTAPARPLCVVWAGHMSELGIKIIITLASCARPMASVRGCVRDCPSHFASRLCVAQLLVVLLAGGV